MKYRIEEGDSVIVKKGVVDPDYGNTIEGWTGIVVEKTKTDDADPLICVQWDSKTLKRMPRSIIEVSENNGLDWTGMYLKMSDLEHTKSDLKEKKQVVMRTIENISKKYRLDKIMNRNKENSQEISRCKKENTYLVTMTGEPYQLVRIHFSVHNKNKVLEKLTQLNCITYNEHQNIWRWVYKDEAKSLKFKKSYPLSRKKRPIILGTFHFGPTIHQMYLNVTSFERATKGIIFFDKHIKRSHAKVTDIEVVNKLFKAVQAGLPHHDDYFDIQKTQKTLPEVLINRLSMIASSIDDTRIRSDLSFSYLEKIAKEPLAEVERFPIYYYEDGIEKIQTSLRMRQFIALQHWNGRTDYTFYDLSHEIIYR
jgi:hypothetical protein